MKRIAAIFLMAGFFCVGSSLAAAAPPKVSEDIFQWVQSSSRVNYYFNKEQICYAVDAQGKIDLNTLIVPILKTYDTVQIQDIIDKRRWKMEPTDRYVDLAGDAEYVRIDLAKNIVTFDEFDYIDSTWTTIEAMHPDKTIEIGKLSEKSWDHDFYTAIIDYAKENQDVLIARTKGTLKPEDEKRLAAEKKEAAKTSTSTKKQDKKEPK